MRKVIDKRIKVGSLVQHYSAEFRVIEIERDTMILRPCKAR